jgi:uncharacterized phage-associated protein
MEHEKMNNEKLANTVLYLLEQCHGSGTTKLLKLLYLADSEHYRSHLRLITGSTYVALERGPVLDRYKDHFAELERAGVIGKESVPIHGVDRPMERYSALQHANMDAFDQSEVEVLNSVCAKWGQHSGNGLSAFLHGDGPWSWVWNPEQPGAEIPPALMRWADNFPTEADAMKAKEALARPDVAAFLGEIASRQA